MVHIYAAWAEDKNLILGDERGGRWKKIVTEKSARVLTYVEKISRARLGATLWSALEEEFRCGGTIFIMAS